MIYLFIYLFIYLLMTPDRGRQSKKKKKTEGGIKKDLPPH